MTLSRDDILVAPAPESDSVVDRVVAHLVERIVDGTWAAGQRLPTERDLAASVDASRVSVRSAISRLVDWRIIVTRQGSGATVLPRRAWKVEALAPSIRLLMEEERWDALLPLVLDALALRRTVVLDLVERAARQKLEPGALDDARTVVGVAWEERDDTRRFARVDREILPVVLDAAGLHASMWFINSLAESYLTVLDAFELEDIVHDGFVDDHRAVLDHIEAGEPEQARERFADYLDQVEMRTVLALPESLRLRLAAHLQGESP